LKRGRLTWSGKFKSKCKLRGNGPGFNTVDVVTVLRTGKVVAGPRLECSPPAWRYEIAGLVDGYTFVLEILIDYSADYLEDPAVAIRTGFFRRGRRRAVKERRGDELQGDEDFVDA
jgi:hypothetical protein